MEKDRKVKTLSLVALIIAVLGLTVAFARMSTTLNINGTAELKTATWDIHFANLSDLALTGGAEQTTAPKIDGTTTNIGDYAVKLTKPGDSVTYTFDVVNGGSIDADLSTFTLGKPVCESTTATAEADKKIVCDNLTYKLTYTNGGKDVKATDTLKAGETKNLTLKLAFGGDELPEA